jgi:adenine-specific DNA-methyltransferase
MEQTIDTVFSSTSNIVFACDDTHSFLRGVPDSFFQLVITSPPYNIGKSYETRVSNEEYLDTQKFVIEELVRTLSPTGSICWQVGNYIKDGEVFPLDIYFYDIFKRYGLSLLMPILWASCSSDNPSRAQPCSRISPSGSNHFSYLPLAMVISPLSGQTTVL